MGVWVLIGRGDRCQFVERCMRRFFYNRNCQGEQLDKNEEENVDEAVDLRCLHAESSGEVLMESRLAEVLRDDHIPINEHDEEISSVIDSICLSCIKGEKHHTPTLPRKKKK